jgi:homocysteine S-methyltransferase
VLLVYLPLLAPRHAEFLHNVVPGNTMPPAARAARGGAGDRAAEVGLDIAHALLTQIGDQVQGTYIMPSFGRYELAAELVRRVRADRALNQSQASL